MEDPMATPVAKNLTLSTEFETTYSLTLSKALSEPFRLATPLNYCKSVLFGCDEHANG